MPWIGQRASGTGVATLAPIFAVGVVVAACTPFGASSAAGDGMSRSAATGISPTGAGSALATQGAPSPSPSPTPRVAAEGADCTFVLGFADLREKIGSATVGACLADEALQENGDTTQPTTNGQFVFRASDGRAVFTNGSDTWIDGPDGVQKRPNGERFAWEPDAQRGPRSAATPFPLPPPLPGSVVPARRIVAYYGNHLSARMGILGEATPPQMLARLKEQARAYAVADPKIPVQAALELVATVAQEGAGSDGLYRLKMDNEIIEEVAQWAESNNFLLILDVQPGRNSFAPEIQALMPFLKRPYVHLALDPEFAMAPNEKPGEEIGSVDAAAINRAIQTLAELVTAENLPPKLLLVHRFTERMITNYRQIRPDPRVQVAIVMDGFGTPEAKISKYDALVSDQRVQYTGFKLFYRQDKPLMTPRQVLELDPAPHVVIYQ